MIKNIIFDFGGVIYDIDHQKTRDAFVKLGIANFEELFGHAIQTRLFEKFETGSISSSDFRAAIREYLPKFTSDEQIDDAWNALLIGFNPERLALLEKIKKNYRILLLSNTSQIHYLHFMSQLKAQNLSDKFNHLFEKLYFSHQIGMRKPDANLFNFVIQDSLINPNETVFIDDYELNIEAANNIGLKGLLLKPGQDMLDLFSVSGQLKS